MLTGVPSFVAQIFYPVVLLYMVAAFFQGGAGTGSSGLLNNLRSYLWIPIAQNAYRHIPLPQHILHRVQSVSSYYCVLSACPFTLPHTGSSRLPEVQ